MTPDERREAFSSKTSDVQRGRGREFPASGDDGPMELRSAIEAFARHLTVDRGFSEHTVRAYRGDLGDLADFVEQRALAASEAAAIADAPAPAPRMPVDVRERDLETLRDWLWQGSNAGLAKSSLSRHGCRAETSPAGW